MTKISIGRNKEFDQVKDILNSKIDDLRNQRGYLHIAIESPRKGGLSLFFDDLFEELKDNEKYQVVKIRQLLDGTDPKSIILDSISSLANLIKSEIKDIDTTSLFEFAELCYKKTNKVLLLLIDAGKAISEMIDTERTIGEHSSSPLLQFLRILPTRIHDKFPPLGLIVGWTTEFQNASAKWASNDVYQRYSPKIPLWSDFGLDDSWELYEKILDINNIRTIEGPFAGFPRSSIPVGKLIEMAKNSNRTEIDGSFLLNILNSEGKTKEPFEELQKEILIQLCLKDGLISTKDNITFDVDSNYINYDDKGSVVANDKLYEICGITPKKYRASYADSIRRRFEAKDFNLCKEIIEKIANQLKQDKFEWGKDQIENDFANAVFRLNTDFLNNEVFKKQTVHIFCSLNHPSQEILNIIKNLDLEIKQDHERRFEELIMVICFDQSDNQNYKKALKNNGEWCLTTKFEAGLSAHLLPITFPSVDSLINLYMLKSEDIINDIKGKIKKHFNDVNKSYPLLDSNLIISMKDVVIPCKEVTSSNRIALKRATLINKNNVWKPTEDPILSFFDQPNGRNIKSLGDTFWLCPEDLPKIKEAIKQIYGNFLISKGDIFISNIKKPLWLHWENVYKQTLTKIEKLPVSSSLQFKNIIKDYEPGNYEDNCEANKIESCIEKINSISESVNAENENIEILFKEKIEELSKIINEADFKDRLKNDYNTYNEKLNGYYHITGGYDLLLTDIQNAKRSLENVRISLTAIKLFNEELKQYTHEIDSLTTYLNNNKSILKSNLIVDYNNSIDFLRVKLNNIKIDEEEIINSHEQLDKIKGQVTEVNENLTTIRAKIEQVVADVKQNINLINEKYENSSIEYREFKSRIEKNIQFFDSLNDIESNIDRELTEKKLRNALDELDKIKFDDNININQKSLIMNLFFKAKKDISNDIENILSYIENKKIEVKKYKNLYEKLTNTHNELNKNISTLTKIEVKTLYVSGALINKVKSYNDSVDRLKQAITGFNLLEKGCNYDILKGKEDFLKNIGENYYNVFNNFTKINKQILEYKSNNNKVELLKKYNSCIEKYKNSKQKIINEINNYKTEPQKLDMNLAICKKFDDANKIKLNQLYDDLINNIINEDLSDETIENIKSKCIELESNDFLDSIRIKLGNIKTDYDNLYNYLCEVRNGISKIKDLKIKINTKINDCSNNQEYCSIKEELNSLRVNIQDSLISFEKDYSSLEEINSIRQKISRKIEDFSKQYDVLMIRFNEIKIAKEPINSNVTKKEQSFNEPPRTFNKSKLYEYSNEESEIQNLVMLLKSNTKIIKFEVK